MGLWIVGGGMWMWMVVVDLPHSNPNMRTHACAHDRQIKPNPNPKIVLDVLASSDTSLVAILLNGVCPLALRPALRCLCCLRLTDNYWQKNLDDEVIFPPKGGGGVSVRVGLVDGLTFI